MMRCRSPSASPMHGSDQPFSLPDVDPLEITSSCKAVEPIDANNLKIYQTYVPNYQNISISENIQTKKRTGQASFKRRVSVDINSFNLMILSFTRRDSGIIFSQLCDENHQNPSITQHLMCCVGRITLFETSRISSK